jgi:cell pole-organizing protein PopZ
MPELELDSAPILAPLSEPPFPRASPAQILSPPPVASRLTARAPESAAPAAVDSRLLSQSLEKVAWEAFGNLSELIVRDVLKKVEEIAWEVLPQLAERLLREEIARLKAEASRD